MQARAIPLGKQLGEEQQLWQRALGGPASENGSLRQGAGSSEGATAPSAGANVIYALQQQDSRRFAVSGLAIEDRRSPTRPSCTWCDNDGIHSSRLVQWALPEEFHGRIVLHFLPPYSPDHNRIERLWRELHANVTRNHRCATLADLLRRVAAFLRRVSPYPGTKASLLRAPQPRAA